MGAVKEAVETLVRLQAVDDRVRRLREELAEKPRLLAHDRGEVEAARARLAEAERKARDSQKSADRKELDVRTKEESVLKLEGQLNAATSNKVYSDLLLNIRSAQADIARLEEAILVLMDETEALESEVERVRVEVRNAEERYREAEKAVAAEVAALEERLRRRVSMRDLLASEVDPAILAVYDRVREARNGVGITRVGVDGEGGHFCRSCQITITVQDVSVAMGGSKVVQCRSCNRILFVGDEPPAPPEDGDGDA